VRYTCEASGSIKWLHEHQPPWFTAVVAVYLPGRDDDNTVIISEVCATHIGKVLAMAQADVLKHAALPADTDIYSPTDAVRLRLADIDAMLERGELPPLADDIQHEVDLSRSAAERRAEMLAKRD
jgi:hypothetical protein